MSNEIELAWAAGFFDGEGNIRWGISNPKRNQRGSVALTIAQVDRRVLDRFKNAVGVGSVLGPYEPRQENRKPVFIYAAHGSTGVKAYTLIRPFLSEVKVLQGDRVLDLLVSQSDVPKLVRGHKGNDLTGMQFGDLTVLSLCPERKGGLRVWLASCSCGNLSTPNSWNLLNGLTKSCGRHKRIKSCV